MSNDDRYRYVVEGRIEDFSFSCYDVKTYQYLVNVVSDLAFKDSGLLKLRKFWRLLMPALTYHNFSLYRREKTLSYKPIFVSNQFQNFGRILQAVMGELAPIDEKTNFTNNLVMMLRCTPTASEESLRSHWAAFNSANFRLRREREVRIIGLALLGERIGACSSKASTFEETLKLILKNMNVDMALTIVKPSMMLTDFLKNLDPIDVEELPSEVTTKFVVNLK